MQGGSKHSIVIDRQRGFFTEVPVILVSFLVSVYMNLHREKVLTAPNQEPFH